MPVLPESEQISIKDRLQRVATQVGGIYRISNRGVPHLVVSGGSGMCSVCYFGSTRTWRVFYPYPGRDQNKMDFKDESNLVSYLLNLMRS